MRKGIVSEELVTCVQSYDVISALGGYFQEYDYLEFYRDTFWHILLRSFNFCTI